MPRHKFLHLSRRMTPSVKYQTLLQQRSLELCVIMQILTQRKGEGGDLSKTLFFPQIGWGVSLSSRTLIRATSPAHHLQIQSQIFPNTGCCAVPKYMGGTTISTLSNIFHSIMKGFCASICLGFLSCCFWFFFFPFFDKNWIASWVPVCHNSAFTAVIGRTLSGCDSVSYRKKLIQKWCFNIICTTLPH